MRDRSRDLGRKFRSTGRTERRIDRNLRSIGRSLLPSSVLFSKRPGNGKRLGPLSHRSPSALRSRITTTCSIHNRGGNRLSNRVRSKDGRIRRLGPLRRCSPRVRARHATKKTSIATGSNRRGPKRPGPSRRGHNQTSKPLRQTTRRNSGREVERRRLARPAGRRRPAFPLSHRRGAQNLVNSAASPVTRSLRANFDGSSV